MGAGTCHRQSAHYAKTNTMWKPRITTIIAVCVAGYAYCLPVAAQQADQNAAPPKLEKLEEGAAPAVTIRGSESGQKMIQKREQGRVTEVKVKSGNSTYYLKPNVPAGSAVPGDAQSDTTRPAQWKVLEFDLQREQDKKEAAAKATSVPPPPDAQAKEAPAKK
jgi:hypothetical protein